MCELFGASSSTPRGLSRWLLPFRSRGGESADNPDGWGVAFWSRGHPNIEKSPEPGWSSAHFPQLSENLASDLLIAHVRKARHPPVPSLENTHPFVIAYGHDRLHYLEASDGHGRYALLADGPWRPFAHQELRVYQDGALLARHSPRGVALASSGLPG